METKDIYRSYSIDTARKYGIPEAVLIHFFSFWINKNKSKADHVFDGKPWMYISVNQICEFLPEFTADSVRRIIDKLVKDGVLLRDTGKPSAGKKTTWYSLDYSKLSKAEVKVRTRKASKSKKTGTATDVAPKVKYHHQAEDFKKYPFCPQFNDYGKPLYFNDEARAMADNLVERYTIDALMKFRERYPKVTESTMVEFLDMLYFNKDTIKSYMPQKEVSSW